MYHFLKCLISFLALLRHLVTFNFSRFSHCIFISCFPQKSHKIIFLMSPFPTNPNSKLTRPFSPPPIRMSLTFYSSIRGPASGLITRHLKGCPLGVSLAAPASACLSAPKLTGLSSCSQATTWLGRGRLCNHEDWLHYKFISSSLSWAFNATRWSLSLSLVTLVFSLSSYSQMVPTSLLMSQRAP